MCDFKTKVIVLSSIVIAFVGVFYAIDNVRYNFSILRTVNRVVSYFYNNESLQSKNALKIFTKEQLKHYTGEKHSKGLYISILGRIYNVEKGHRHYGPSGGYHFFAARDATAAFVTGNFKEDGLTDDLSAVKIPDYLGIEDWLKFYEKDYVFVGILCGRFYDCKSGEETAALDEYNQKLQLAKKLKEQDKSESELYPSCNSQWRQGFGGHVWCADKSGGITRGWSGVPRLFHMKSDGRMRCACVRDFGPPSTDPHAIEHDNIGDLNDPRLKLYHNCDPHSNSCPIPQT